MADTSPTTIRRCCRFHLAAALPAPFAIWGRATDRLACRLGIWALRRLYGADCETDVRDDFSGENLTCLGCDAKRLVTSMQEILQDG